MRFKSRLFCFLLTSLMTLPALPCSGQDIIYSALYKGDYSGWRLEMTRTLQQTDATHFVLNSYAKNTFASINETSIFTADGTQICPQHYSYTRKIFGKSNDENIDFNWPNKNAIFHRNGHREDAQHVLTPGLLDPALYQLQMQKELANGRQQFNYSFIKRRDIKRYNFAVAGKDLFVLNDTTYNAIIIERQDSNSRKKTRVWILPDLDFQIARIQQKEESGDTYEIKLASYSADNAKLRQFYGLKAKTPAIK